MQQRAASAKQVLAYFSVLFGTIKRRAPATWRRSPSLAFLTSWFALVTLACASSLWTTPAQAACPAVISLSVAHGGTVSYNASSCDPFGVNGNIEEAPLHGTAVSNTIDSMVTYTHFGGSNTATSDTFVFDDASNVNHRINVTIGSASAITITPPTINVPQVGVPFSQALSASGGTAPYTYTIDSGSIPGLSLTSGGVLSGIPSHRPSSTVTIRATDNLGAFGLQSYTVDPANPTITASPTSPPNAAVGLPYSITFTGAGGITPYNFTLAVGSAPLPPGLSLSAAGVLSGTPTTANTYTFRIRVADSSTGPGVMFAEVDITLIVAAAPTIVVNPATIPGATVSAAYSQTFTGSGGVSPYTFAITAGALPAGLSLNTGTGGLSGTPTAAGTFNFTVRATDSSTGSGPFSGTRAYTLVVAPPVTVIAPPTLPNGTVAAAYNQTVTASGGIAPYTYTVAAGALPAGLSLSSGGALTGTPTAGGTFNFTVTATGSSTGTGVPHTGSRAYSLVISPPSVTLPATTLANGTQSVAYSATLNPASGGTAPYTYAVTAGGLPAGIALSSGGVLSGTPTASGTFNFAVTATDSSTGSGPYSSAPRGYTLQIVNVPPVANPVSATVSQNSSANPITLNITGGVPTSVAIGTAAANGTAIASGTSITYQPNAGFSGPDSFTYTATNSAGTSAPATVTITVTDPVITLAPSGGFTAQVGVAYTNTFTWTGGTQPFTGLAATGLPAGLSVTGTTANSLTVSGTPTEAGSFSLNVTGTDSSIGNGPFTVDDDYVLTVSAPTLALTPPAGTLSATYGVAYSQTYVASGGTAPYTYTVSAGALPAGLNLTGGVLSGTPTVTGLFTFSVRATDTSTGTGAPFARTQNYVMQVAAPTITLAPTTLPAGQVAVAYSQTLTATGGIAPYTFAVAAGSLPPGISLASDGTVSGTATGAGTYNLTITATDANGQAGSRAYALTVGAPTMTMTPAPGNLALTYGAPYSQTFVAGGGTASYTFSIASGSVPAGISLSSAGVLSGTPTVPGNFPLTIEVTDSTTGTGAPFSLQQSYVLQIGAPTIVINPTTLPNPVIGQAYAQTITASGGVGTHTISVMAGTLPTGISLDSAGVLSGTPTAAGTFSLTIQASDANGQTATQIYTLTIAPPALAMTPPAGTLTLPYGAAYSQTFTASGGTGPYTFSIPSGSLPAGISFSSGVLSGTPTAPGSYPLTIRVTDATTGAGAPFSLDQNYVLDIPAPTIVIDPATLPTPAIGQAYSQTITASGGVGTHTISLAAGTLPDGMNFTAGVLSGTPTSAGNYALTVQAADANGQMATQIYNFTIAQPTLTMAPPAGTLTVPYGVAYSQTFSATGGTAPRTLSVTSGPLPAGLTFVAGVLSGTPTAPGSYPLTVRVTDSSTGAGAPFTLDLPYGAPYSQTFVASGGIAPHSYAQSGALPAGVSFSSGTLSGTPTAPGTYTITVQASDSSTGAGAPFTVTNTYTLQVDAPTITITPATLPNGIIDQAYNQALSASGGVAPHGYTIVAGALPAGINLSSAGVFSGTPTTQGSYNFTVRATDTYGQTGDAAYTLQVIYNAPVAVADNAATMAGQAVTIAVTSNDTGDITSIAVASAPANGTATVDGFNIVYTPADTFGGTDTFTYVAVGPGGTSAPATVSIDVALRDDPTEDAEVMGILNAQTAATRRFASSQIGNFQQRMEGIHDEGGSENPEALGDGVTFLHGLSLNITDRCTDAERVETNCGQPGEMNYTDELGMGERSLRSHEKAFAAFDTASAQKRNRLTVWTGGVVNFGEQEDGTDEGVKFTTTGVSAGADYRLNQYLTLGAGLGYGRDDSDIGDNGSTSDGESYTAALYGSYKPNDTLFVDALVGYQWLSFDSQRYVTQTGGFVDGERDGHQIFASLSAGAKFKFDEFMVSPYGRLDVARATLDAFTESGDALYALHYGEQDISTTTGTLGIRLNYSYVLPVGVFKPELRAEYQHDFEADSALTLNYADMMGGPFYRAEIGGLDRDRFVFGLGASLETENDMTMRFEYRGMFGSEGDTDHGFLLNLQKQF